MVYSSFNLSVVYYYLYYVFYIVIVWIIKSRPFKYVIIKT